MSDSRNRRQFPRLLVSEEARVYDQNGRELGKVAEVSGNGMNIELASEKVGESLAAGSRLRITVVEPGSRATNVLDVLVHRRAENKVGIEFLNLLPDRPV